MLARGHSRVLNALYNAEAAAKAAAEPCESFHQIMARRGTDVPRLARELGIARSVLADVVNGGVLPPAGQRLVDAFTRRSTLLPKPSQGPATCSNAPRLGHAKADGAPTIIPRPYEEVIRTSKTPPERVEYWLSND